MTKRIGPKMQAVVEYVAKNPGVTKREAGEAAWNSSRPVRMSYMYGPVNRAIAAGLIDATLEAGRYSLMVAIATEEQ